MVVGAMLSPAILASKVLWLAPVLLLVIRPVAILLGLFRSRSGRRERALIGWFGIRGIG